MLLQQIVSGLINGSAYSLVAVGLVMIYKATRMLNFAQGEFFMLGAYGGFFFYVILGFNYIIAFIFAISATCAIGLICEKLACKPLIKASHLSLITSLVGLSVALKGLIRLVVGPHELPFPPIMSNEPVNIYGLIITPQQMITIVFTFIFLIVLSIFFRFTKLGKSMRAVCSNQDASPLMGISVERVFSITWGLSALLGATGGVLLAPVIIISPDMGTILVKAFAAAAIGGFTSLGGSVIGGFLVGLMENIAGGYLRTSLSEVVAFWTLMAILILKPSGLFGKREIKRV